MKTLYPPNTIIIKENVTLTKDNFGFHFVGFPFNYAGNNTWDLLSQDNRSNNYPVGNAAYQNPRYHEGFGWVRLFRPSAKNMWNPANSGAARLSPNGLDALLKTFDWWLERDIKVLLVLGLVLDQETEVWAGIVQSTATHEQQCIDYITALLTSTVTSPLGYTFANHPALVAVEPSNETELYSDQATIARVQRVVYKLFRQYKPNCKIGSFGASGGVPRQTGDILASSALSIIPAGVGSPPDDGTNKTCAHYLDFHSHHWYNNCEALSGSNASLKATNNYPASFRTQNVHNQAVGHGVGMHKHFLTSSPYYNLDMPIWNTECGPLEQNNSDAALGRLTPEERRQLLLKEFVPKVFMTSDGAGGLGVSISYAGDIAKVTGTQSSISSASANGNGDVVLLIPNAPTNGWTNPDTITIKTTTNPWPLLGLDANDLRTFGIKAVSGTQVTLAEVSTGSSLTVPSGVTCNFFRKAFSPYAEDFRWLWRILYGAPITFGIIPYSDGFYGTMVHRHGSPPYYTDITGVVRRWQG
jgi:hypothetical protein